MLDELLQFERQQEGFRPKAYLDQVGLPTIGYGFRVPSLDVPDMTREDADKKLKAHLLSIMAWVLTTSPVLQHETRRLCAIIDFCYNAGEEAYRTSQLRKCVDAKDWHGAAVQMRRWVHGHKNGQVVVVPALVMRRNITSRWLETG